MRYHDLSISTQILLAGLLAFVLLAVLIRALTFFHRSLTRVPHRYPWTWTPAQCRLLERAGQTLGLVLGLLWAGLLIAATPLPINSPFGFLEVALLLVLLLLPCAWSSAPRAPIAIAGPVIVSLSTRLSDQRT